ncbi:MAG: hypothetical protein ACPHC0_02765, partial [Nitrosopumilus sp.]
VITQFIVKILRIIMNDDLPDTVKKCLDILDENLEILSNIEIDLNDEKNDELVPEMKLHHLYDMSEDVAESEKIKRAESKFMRRQSEDF